MQAQTVLLKQFKELTKNPVEGFTVDLVDENIFEWQVGLFGIPDSIYQGGYFLARIKFPASFPFQPPTFQFNNPLFHPNIYPDGRVCISILHPPGDDPQSGEKACERWNPTQTVESILISIVSLLTDPNTSSPANIDAGVLLRNDKTAYINIVKKQVEISKKDIPISLKIPTNSDSYILSKTQEKTPDYEQEFCWQDDSDHSDFPCFSDEED